MKNLGVLISESLFPGLASLGEAKQGISRSISLFLTIIDSNVVSRELLGPTDNGQHNINHIFYIG